MELKITVKQYLEVLNKHTLVKLVWENYADTEEGYNLWIKSPFANCVFMDAEHTLDNMINYYEWIGDMALKGIKEYDNYFASTKKNIKQVTLIF